MFTKKLRRFTLTIVWMHLLLLSSGCMAHRRHAHNAQVMHNWPTEAAKTILPEHIIAPPDILLIDAVTLVPRPPYLVRPLDALAIHVRVFGAKEEKQGLVP